MAINYGRVLIGGLAAGFVMNVVDSVVNGFLLASRWNAESTLLNKRLLTAGTTSMAGWITVDFLMGIFIVWLYAAVRPRYGPGAGTAIKAGLAAWFITHVFMMSYVFMDLFTPNLIMLVSLGGLVATLAGAYVGGMLYKEEGGAVIA
jgi:hypothetical protein